MRGCSMDCRKQEDFFQSLLKSMIAGNAATGKRMNSSLSAILISASIIFFRDCPQIEIEKDHLYYFSEKLKRLLLEAALHQEGNHFGFP